MIPAEAEKSFQEQVGAGELWATDGHAFRLGFLAGRAAGLRAALAAEPTIAERMSLGFGVLGGKSWALWMSRILALIPPTKETP